MLGRGSTESAGIPGRFHRVIAAPLAKRGDRRGQSPPETQSFHGLSPVAAYPHPSPLPPPTAPPPHGHVCLGDHWRSLIDLSSPPAPSSPHRPGQRSACACPADPWRSGGAPAIRKPTRRRRSITRCRAEGTLARHARVPAQRHRDRTSRHVCIRVREVTGKWENDRMGTCGPGRGREGGMVIGDGCGVVGSAVRSCWSAPSSHTGFAVLHTRKTGARTSRAVSENERGKGSQADSVGEWRTVWRLCGSPGAH
jgi:hypothetical protein